MKKYATTTMWSRMVLSTRTLFSFSIAGLATRCCTTTQAETSRVFDELQMLSVDAVVGDAAPPFDANLFEQVNFETGSYSPCCDDFCCSTGSGVSCYVPNMIGTSLTMPNRGLGINNYWQTTRVSTNNSAVPQDRVAFNYNYSHHVPKVRSAIAAPSDTNTHDYSFMLE